ncbi:MAG: hypothetical protein ACE5J1_05965 [Nitrospiria bacterium]
MKQAMPKETIDVLHKIETIEDGLLDLKLSILKKLSPSKKNLISLKGILKGVKISEEDIEKSQKSLYSKMKI